MSKNSAILRRWVGTIRTSDTLEYVSYIKRTGVADYVATPGNLGCQMLVRDCGSGISEVTTLSWWTSEDAIRAFAGPDADVARYYPEDDKFLLDRSEKVEHHDVFVDEVGLRAAAERRSDSGYAPTPPAISF